MNDWVTLSAFCGRLSADRLNGVSSSFHMSRSIGVAALAALSAATAGCNAHGPKPVASVRGLPASNVALAGVAPGRPTVTAEVTAPKAGGGQGDQPYAIAGKIKTPRERGGGTVGVGLASWYGDRFHGRRTANGERYDMQVLSAAHPTLPLPSYARVTNVQNGRSVVVRINDRGPFHRGRLIDVSRRTADVLGFRLSGVGNVKVDYIGSAALHGSDDRKLIATYQEFGRPSAPDGVQMAGVRPVSDAEIARGASGATQVAQTAPADAAPGPSAVAAVPRSTAVAAYAPPLPLAGPPALRGALATSQGQAAFAVPLAVASSGGVRPAAAPELSVVADPAASKRVIRAAAPVLASGGPQLPLSRLQVVATTPSQVISPAGSVTLDRAAQASPQVAARIAASFDSFAPPAPLPSGVRPDLGPASAFQGLR